MLGYYLEKADVEKGNRVAVMFLFPTSFHSILKTQVPEELRDFVWVTISLYSLSAMIHVVSKLFGWDLISPRNDLSQHCQGLQITFISPWFSKSRRQYCHVHSTMVGKNATLLFLFVLCQRRHLNYSAGLLINS